MTHWRDIPGFETLYQVARPDWVRSLDRAVPERSRWGHTVTTSHRGHVLKPYRCKNGRKRVVLHDHAHRRHLRYVDQLIAETFGREVTEARRDRCELNDHPHNHPVDDRARK